MVQAFLILEFLQYSASNLGTGGASNLNILGQALLLMLPNWVCYNFLFWNPSHLSTLVLIDEINVMLEDRSSCHIALSIMATGLSKVQKKKSIDSTFTQFNTGLIDLISTSTM